MEISADGYAAAVRAIEWMSPMTLEDSAEPGRTPDWDVRRATEEDRLEEARNLVGRVAARAKGDLGAQAGLLAGQLSYFDGQWRSARAQYEKRQLRAGGGDMFDLYWKKFNTAREALVGADGGDWHRDVPSTSDPVVAAGSTLAAFKTAYLDYS